MSVSRETCDRLQIYADLLRVWSKKINLVSPRTLETLESRHLEDSAQISPYAGHWSTWCDLGSGGGLPGLVVSIHNPDKQVTLIESDQRKSIFLKHVSRTLALKTTILNERIENTVAQSADIVSARALAPLHQLIPLAVRHAHPRTRFIFLKGAQWRTEVAEAQKTYRFDIDARPSITDKDAIVLILENIERV